MDINYYFNSRNQSKEVLLLVSLFLNLKSSGNFAKIIGRVSDRGWI